MFLVEVGHHFQSVLKPRLLKASYSKEWMDGCPAPNSGVSHVLKYASLESYEDALNNLLVSKDQRQHELVQNNDQLREDYMLSYALNIETEGSPSLLNIDAFEDPWSYKLKITRNDETRDVNVDLVETFNYLIGLKVRHMARVGKIYTVEGVLNDPSRPNNDGDKVLVLWRNTKEVDSDALDEWFEKQGYNSRDLEYDLIYVNGDNNLENLRRQDQTWKVRLIEQEFHRLMFDVQDV